MDLCAHARAGRAAGLDDRWLGFTRDSQNPSLGILVVAVGNRLARGAAFVVDDGVRSAQYRLLWLLSIIVLPLFILGITVILFTLRHPLVIKLRAKPQALIDELPLAAVPVALRRLSMARALPEVFTQLGLPRDRERLISVLAQRWQCCFAVGAAPAGSGWPFWDAARGGAGRGQDRRAWSAAAGGSPAVIPRSSRPIRPRWWRSRLRPAAR